MRDHEAPRVAARQGGVFTARQAVEAGLTQRQVRYRVQTHVWHPVLGRGLTDRPRPPSGWPAPMLGHAALLTWPDAAIGFQLAGSLLGFPVPPAELTGPVHLFSTVKHDARPGLVLHAQRPGPPRLRVAAEGLVVTDPRRTAIDCLTAMQPGAALDLFAWLSTREVLDQADLGRAVRARFGQPGVAALRRLQRRTATGAVSEAERRAHSLLRRAGISGWIPGARVFDRAGLIGVVDILFPAAGVVVEIDGRRAHDDPGRFESDRRRQNRLILAGYIVLRYTWSQLVHEPDQVVAELCQTLADRELTRGR